MKRLMLRTNKKEAIVVTCSCGKKFELRLPAKSGAKQIVVDAPEETKIHREPEKVRLIEGSH